MHQDRGVCTTVADSLQATGSHPGFRDATRHREYCEHRLLPAHDVVDGAGGHVLLRAAPLEHPADSKSRPSLSGVLERRALVFVLRCDPRTLCLEAAASHDDPLQDLRKLGECVLWMRNSMPTSICMFILDLQRANQSIRIPFRLEMPQSIECIDADVIE